MTETQIGYIRGNTLPGECDEAFEKIKTWLEESRVYANLSTVTGFLESETEPGVDDRDKLWLKSDSTGKYWYYWSATCAKWCRIDGAPGDRITRYRINETVQEDIDEWFPCGWELADGTNSLSVDLVGSSPTQLGVYSVALNAPQYAVESITVQDGSSLTTYDGLDDGTIYDTISDLADALNIDFTSGSIPLTASEVNGCLKIVPDDPTVTVLSGVDGNGNALIV
jgi:hypothetical protein